MKKKLFLFWVIVLGPFGIAMAQVNMTKYITNDMFDTQPVFDLEDLEEEETESKSFIQLEIDKGMKLWEEGELDDAIALFEAMTESYSNFSQGYYWIGSIYLDKEDWVEARQNFNLAIKEDPLFYEARYMLGLISVYEGDYKEAKKEMEVLVNIPAYAAQGYHGLAMIATDQREYTRAWSMYNKCLKEDSLFREAYLPMASLDLQYFGNWKRALKRLNQAVSIDSMWQEARISRGLLSLMTKGGIDQFTKDLEVLIRQAPDNYHYRSIKGYLNIELEQYSEAVHSFYQALSMEVDSLNTGKYKFNTALKKNQNLQSALSYYFRENVELSDSTRRYIDRGICEFIEGNHKQAQVYYATAAGRQPHAVIDMLKAIQFQSMWGKDKEAILSYTAAIEKDSTIYACYFNRGGLYLSLQQDSLAMADFNQLIRLDPRAKVGYKNRANLRMRRGFSAKAYQDYTVAIMLDSTDSDLFYNRGYCLFTHAEFDRAIDDFKMAISFNEKDADSYYWWAMCKYNQQDTLSTLVLLDSASKIGKYNDDYHKYLLQLSIDLEKKDSQEEALNRLVKYNGWKSEYRYDRAKFYYHEGELDKALKDLEYLIRRDKGQGGYHYYKGMILSEQGNQKGAERALMKSQKLGYKEEKE
ncbi:hypothetical protein BFP72_06430 [Reichenbachiella sp. 5M10]|uniref:tetratricopeptide repeat protein n=1 Tax=Reichenbachiella sp. 5M10 TaxID=1889772 RepID=UPI000C154FCF|nr:tetratricopeptide repeat protein [Reichenbachiella sp. 5M10]PIB35057.1 hypothetical protein BFP72_06430 [Reichenbachiella sp. 5M10]